MIFQNSNHQRIFEIEKPNLYKPSNRSLAALYLLTADYPLWIKTKRYIDRSGKVDLKSVHLGDISTDGYALWKAVKELQTGEKQYSCVNCRTAICVYFPDFSCQALKLYEYSYII